MGKKASRSFSIAKKLSRDVYGPRFVSYEYEPIPPNSKNNYVHNPKEQRLDTRYAMWYPNAVILPWSNDEVMTWAKDARNKIEKEGDLELNSTLNVKLLFSYLEENDIHIRCEHVELLSAGIKRLVRLAQKKLPSRISDAAAVKIERRWVTASLPQWELLHALSYVYSRMYDCCLGLAKQFGETLDESIPNISTFDQLRNDARKVRYIKINGLQVFSAASETIEIDRNFVPPQNIRAVVEEIGNDEQGPRDFAQGLNYYVKMAEATFNQYGNHVSMLFIIDESWKPLDMLGVQFADQTDKFIFWRNVADRIVTLKASGIVWISEAWLRDNKAHTSVAIRNMPIIGERLHVNAINRSGSKKQVEWEIIRDQKTKIPTLKLLENTNSQNDNQPFFLIPVSRALGLTDPPYINDHDS